jgi:hypothetical protein
MRSALGVLMLFGLELAHPAGAGAQALSHGGLTGACYDLSIGPWHPAQQLREDSIFVAPPSRVRFNTARSERRPDHFVLLTAPGALPSVHRYAMWRLVGSDTVELIWSTGFSGLRMTLGGRPGELRGLAQAFWDFPRTPLIADASARRVPCDPPARPTAQRLVFRAVPLVDGDSVALGAPFAPVRPQADSLRGRRFRMRRAPTGPFARATSVEVGVNARDTIWIMEVSYPTGTEFESLVAELSSALGAPVSRDTVSSVWAAWSNRTTRLTLRRWATTSGERRITATLTDPRLRR